MKHQYKQEGFEPSNLVVEDYDFIGYTDKLLKLIQKPIIERRHTTISILDKPFINCPICGGKFEYKIFNHMGWEWPSHLTHMMFAHNIKPSQDFLDAVLRDEQ